MLLNNISVAGNSKPVSSSQTEIHPRLSQLLVRHNMSVWQEPCKQYNRDALAAAQHFVAQQQKPVIADIGCGTGESTRLLAELFPDCCVVGIDKSAHRLQKSLQQPLPNNCLILRADYFEFVYYSHQYQIKFDAILLLYPNPWPKPQYIQRRWHGHPVFPSFLSLAPYIELRTNWQMYANEFAFAAEQLTTTAHMQNALFTPLTPLTPFEAKYRYSGHDLHRVIIQKDENSTLIRQQLSTLIKKV